MDNATNRSYQPSEEYDRNDLQELRDALDALSPHDFAAWTAWVESRLTERLRQRQAHGRTGPEEPPEQPDL